ncbi:hypothetical protein FRC12_010607 [Ceratobasidium sp. 428]|nr:hypothetical protein FRC12_010607 [Ceratobasidium sp. 428]
MASISSTPPLGGSSATQTTSQTTGAAVKLSHSTPSRRLLKGASAAMRIIGTTIGLPGVSEVGEKAGQLIRVRSPALLEGPAQLVLSKLQASTMQKLPT